MKKASIISIITLVMVLMIGLGAKAQRGDILAGGGLVYATDIDQLGICLSGVYQVTPEWEGAADFVLFATQKGSGSHLEWKHKTRVLNLNAHYVFYNEDQITAYGIGGISMLFWKNKREYESYTYQGEWHDGGTYKTHGSDFGVNLGAGGRYQISDELYGVAELKFVIIDGSYFQIGAGVQYRF